MSQIKTYCAAEIRCGTQDGSFLALADHEDAIAAANHHVMLLGKALGECIEAAGITRPGAALTGPQLLMFADDLKRVFADREPQAEQKCATCQGHGVIGWTTGQTPESFDQGEAPCEDCGATGYAQSNGMPASGTCTTCNGLGTVPDGEITGMGGVEFDNGPIKCVKDCPDCAAVACRLPEPEQLHKAIAGALGEALDCTRVWAAWGVGTMSEDDFTPIADNQERLHEIATACLTRIKELSQ